MSPQFFQEAMRLALEHELYVEINLRYNLPPEPFISFIPSSKAVVGVDAHSVDEVKRLGEIILDLESTIADRSSTRAKRGDYEAR
jgi:hypothetical protein